MLIRSLSVMLKGSLTSGSLSLTTSCLGPDLGPPQLKPNLCDNKVMVTADVCLAYYSDILKRVLPFAIYHDVVYLAFGHCFHLMMFKLLVAYGCFCEQKKVLPITVSSRLLLSLLVWNSVRSFGPATNLNCCFGVSGEQM